MREFGLILIALLLTATVIAQDDNTFDRNGRWTLETGTSFFTGISSGSGGSILFDDGTTIVSLGLDIGKFVSENFVVKLKLGLLDAEGSITNISGGIKYYLGGIAPLEANAGFLSGFGSTEFIGDVHLGYAIVLADNIYLEPKGGILYSNESTAGSVKFSFAMIF